MSFYLHSMYFSTRSVFFMVLVFLSIQLWSCREESAEQPWLTSGTNAAPELSSRPESHTGIDFNNQLTETDNLNVFIWNFLYTGAGVAVGDISGDGLPDIYFAGNMVSDKLYLNKGNFTFEDITSSSGIDGSGWSTGVTMADVNADGLMDIYVCKNSPTAIARNNRNKLFVNLGNNTFTEQATEYGIDDIGFSVQATFFDLENDGDLDMYLANQPFDQFARLVNPAEQVSSYPETDRLFLMENGRFIDVTEQYGLLNARYGLNVTLSDVNLDGWTDLYVSNDYHHADHLYINYYGRLSDEIRERTGHISFYSMGADAGDINNDGWPDICVLDMAFDDHYRSKTNMESMQPERFWQLVSEGQHYQYAQNTMQLNRGYGYFSDVAQISGLSKTDWSGAPLFADIDHDGLQDLLVTNGIFRDMKNNDFNEWVKSRFGGAVGPANLREVMSRLPTVPVKNRLYRNKGSLQFDNLTESSGFGFEGFSHGLAYGDLDNDGDLDLVVNNMNSPAGIYENTTAGKGNWLAVALKGSNGNTMALGASVIVYNNLGTHAGTMQTTRGFLSSSEPILHFGLGTSDLVDSVKVLWNQRHMTVLKRVKANQRLVIDFQDSEKSAMNPQVPDELKLEEGPAIDHVHQEKPFNDYAAQVLLPYKLSENGPFHEIGDVNGDGYEDIWIGGASGQAGKILCNNTNGQFIAVSNPDFDTDSLYEDMQGLLFEADGDGDLDLYVVSGSNEFPTKSPMLADRLYLNDGMGHFTRDMEAVPSDLRINGQCVAPFDLEGDGDIDLFVAGRLVSNRYPVPAGAAVLVNDEGTFSNATAQVAPYLKNFGLITGISTDDLDSDGDEDFLVVGEWMEPLVLLNDNGKLTISEYRVSPMNGDSLSPDLTGIWWSIEKGDFDNDGDLDFLLGNLGWNNKFGGAHPHLEVYAGDLDGNGDHDVVLAKESDGRVLPVRGRECSSEEMPFIAQKFSSYDAFGRAELASILPGLDETADFYSKIGTMSSIMLLNHGNLHFTVVELPLECQLGPIKSFAVGDFNDDNIPDFLYSGNHLPVEVETARYDGLVPGICLSPHFPASTHQVLTSDDRPLGTSPVAAIYLLPSARTPTAVLNLNGQLSLIHL